MGSKEFVLPELRLPGFAKGWCWEFCLIRHKALQISLRVWRPYPTEHLLLHQTLISLQEIEYAKDKKVYLQQSIDAVASLVQDNNPHLR